MSMTMIIIISLLVLNLGMTLIMFWIIHDLLEATKSLQDSEDLLKKFFDINNQLIEKYNERVNILYDGINQWQKNAEQSYDAICSAYKTMYEQYKFITDMQTKLLECWKGCEERYSQSYEQFKHCSDQLKELSFQVTDLANVSTEDEYYLTLQEACDTVCCDCPNDDLNKCKNCPVHEVMHRNDIPDGIEGETPPDQEAMKEFFETDGFKDIREKGDDS